MKVTAQIKPIRLFEAIALFLKHKEADGAATNTMKRYGTDMRRLREFVGDIYVHQVSPIHIDRIMQDHVNRGNGQGAKNNTITNLRVFFEWCRRNKYMSPWPWDDPTAHIKRKTYEVEQPPPISHEDWPILLDLADRRHPLHRAFFAIGLYTFARSNEVAPLRLWDVNLKGSSWTINITRTKTRRAGDPFQMSNELCTEITRWLTWYNCWALENLGVPLQRDWHLIPRLRRVGPPNAPLRESGRLYPHLGRHVGTFGQITFPVLEQYGYPVRDENGEPNRWGGAHALRRAGARAWYEELRRNEGRDFALRTVQAALGHKTQAMTEHYLGLDPDREFRNEMLRGKYMFLSNDPATRAADGTVRLHAASAREDLEGTVAQLPRFLWTA